MEGAFLKFAIAYLAFLSAVRWRSPLDQGQSNNPWDVASDPVAASKKIRWTQL